VSAATALMWMASPGKGWGRQCGSTSACSCGWVAPGRSTGGHELWHPWDAATPALRCPPPAQLQQGERVTESPCCRRLCPSLHPRCALQTIYTPTTPHQSSLPAKLQSKPTCSQPRAFTRPRACTAGTATQRPPRSVQYMAQCSPAVMMGWERAPTGGHSPHLLTRHPRSHSLTTSGAAGAPQAACSGRHNETGSSRCDPAMCQRCYCC
jgi:hypothetical protein